MNERSVVVLGAVVGAALGGLAGYLFLTERGRQLRRELEPRIDELMRELSGVQGTIARARAAAVGGSRAADVAGDRRWTEPSSPASH